METSIFLARLFAVVYVGAGLGMLFNYAHFKKALDEMMKSTAGLFYGGIMALVAGFLILNFHNVWVKDWTVIITILGWLALLKGILLLLVPKAMIALSRSFMKSMWFAILFALIIGGVLGYFGFFA